MHFYNSLPQKAYVETIPTESQSINFHLQLNHLHGIGHIKVDMLKQHVYIISMQAITTCIGLR